MSGFDQLGLSESTLQAVHRLGWRVPTPIQRASLPQLMAGRDVVAEAETGSGKTGAFGMWLVERARGPGLGALVLVPTRELAVQVASDLQAIAHGSTFRAVAVHGGVAWEPQLAAMRDPATTCVVATPGRLLDFVRERKLPVAEMRFAVLDECDRMLDLGFMKDVERILADLPKGRQVAMFSATVPPEIERLARRFLPVARIVRPEGRPTVPESSEHFRIDVPSSQRREALLKLLRLEDPESCLVFCRTRADADDLGSWLALHDVRASALHGDLAQASREDVLARFRAGQVRVLAATDLAGRGLDIPAVTHVVNHHAPEEPDAYVHRAGRTARAGRPGRVFSLVTEKDATAFEAALRGTGVRPRMFRLPGIEPPPALRPDAPASQRPRFATRKKADKKRSKPGWEKRKGRG
ncbi:MAG TPA: DEAD/DEAH box helicase [Candidatus Thermoplasmatota archaeon]|nr:DEAD/DEAH box helicase [Candidatus Thermoplasmatota archaeon]